MSARPSTRFCFLSCLYRENGKSICGCPLAQIPMLVCVVCRRWRHQTTRRSRPSSWRTRLSSVQGKSPKGMHACVKRHGANVAHCAMGAGTRRTGSTCSLGGTAKIRKSMLWGGESGGRGGGTALNMDCRRVPSQGPGRIQRKAVAGRDACGCGGRQAQVAVERNNPHDDGRYTLQTLSTRVCRARKGGGLSISSGCTSSPF